MHYYTLHRIEYCNFKHIPDGAPVEFELSTHDLSKNITILDGPNGYGKTTLFQAVELILTGEIRDFKKDLKSKGTDDYRILANDSTSPMKLTIEFIGDNEDTLKITRKWDFQSPEENTSVTINDISVTQGALEDRLNFNNHIFDLGIYLSQKESLSFLQNKYKDRGSQLASILDTSSIQEKVSYVESVKSALQEKQRDILSSLDLELAPLESQQNELRLQLSTSPQNSIHPPYKHLFPDKHYHFDERNLDFNITYDLQIEALEQLKEFLENYSVYRKTSDNIILDKLIGVSRTSYFALFNQKFIDILDANTSLLDDLHFAQHALENLNANRFPINCDIYTSIGVSRKDSDELSDISLKINILTKQLGNKEAAMQEIMDARRGFISAYQNHKKASEIEPHTCPLCGTKLDNLLAAIKRAELELQGSYSDLQEQIKITKKQQIEIGKRIIKDIEAFIGKNYTLLEIENSLSAVRHVDSSSLKKELSSIGITNFSSSESLPSKDTFDSAYNSVIEQIQKKKNSISTVLSEQQLTTYNRIHEMYYDNSEPSHTPAQIQEKLEYIAFAYSQKANIKYQSISAEVVKIKQKRDTAKLLYDRQIELLTTLLQKFQLAQTEYNRIIQQALCLPVYIYSGRIIQNYPLGLGIYAEIDAKKIILRPELKDDDVYNVLSAGQLNGLALAILLAVHAVYATNVKFNILMIDDPLQSIDEVSSISLIDLLTEQFDLGQILISTHEPYKADLFQYKFSQSGFHVNRINMQQKYLQLQNHH